MPPTEWIDMEPNWAVTPYNMEPNWAHPSTAITQPNHNDNARSKSNPNLNHNNDDSNNRSTISAISTISCV